MFIFIPFYRIKSKLHNLAFTVLHNLSLLPP